MQAGLHSKDSLLTAVTQLNLICAAAMGMLTSAVIAGPQRQLTGGGMLASTPGAAGALHLLAVTHSHYLMHAAAMGMLTLLLKHLLSLQVSQDSRYRLASQYPCKMPHFMKRRGRQSRALDITGFVKPVSNAEESH